MKITANQYARALFELVDNKTEQEIDKLVLNIVKIVGKNRQIKLFPKIIEKFRLIWNSKYKISEVEITSREKLDSETENKIGEYIRRKYRTEKVVINNKIDINIIGGIIIKVGDEVLNQSIAEQLKKLSRNLTK